MGFEEIRYRGKPVLRDVVDDTLGDAYYQHIYLSNFGSKALGRHACMQWGNWCWKQAREYPLDAVKFLLGGLSKQG